MSNFISLNGFDVKDAESRKISFPFIGINPPKKIDDFAAYEYLQNTLAEPYYTSDGMRSLQGCCYIDDLDAFCVSAVNSGAGYTEATLCLIDRNYNLLSNYAPLPLGHCGDLAYDPVKKYIYAAVGSTGIYANEIVVINRLTMSVINHFSVPGISSVKTLALDWDNQKWYIGSDDTIVQTDIDFNILNTWPKTISYVGNYTFTHQSAFCYKGIHYIIGTVLTTSADNIDEFTAACIIQMDEGNVVNVFEYSPALLTIETQAGVIVNDRLYLFQGQSWFSVSYFDLNRKNVHDLPATESYVLIPSNSDLDDYKIQGRYFISSAAIASTISNIPYSNSGMELIISAQGNWIKQIVITNNGRCFCRIYQASNGVFSDWIRWDNNYGYIDLNADVANSLAAGVATIGTDIYVADNEVQINGRFTFPSLAAATWTHLFTIPAPYRISASSAEYFPCVTMSGNAGVATLRTGPNGKVEIYAPAAGATDCRISIRYRIGS